MILPYLWYQGHDDRSPDPLLLRSTLGVSEEKTKIITKQKTAGDGMLFGRGKWTVTSMEVVSTAEYNICLQENCAF